MPDNLPDVLVHAENVEYLTGRGCFLENNSRLGALQSALAFYSSEVDLWAISRGKMGKWPTLHVMAVAGRDGEQYVRHKISQTEIETRGVLIIGQIHPDESVECLVCDVRDVLWGAPDLRGTYTLYVHAFGEDGELGVVDSGRAYIGITRRGIVTRWKEHLASARAGSSYRFHQAIRCRENRGISHHALATGLSYEQALQFEEWAVDKYTLAPNGLNMIPGGHAGFRFLSNLRVKVTPRRWEHKDREVSAFIKREISRGRPNPLAPVMWTDQRVEKMIFSNQRNFSRAAVDDIRFQASGGLSASSIARRFGVRDGRVSSLLSGATYSRVR